MMYDQLHQFETLQDAVAAFPWGRGEDGQPIPATVWAHDGVSVMLSQIRMHSPDLDAVDPETGELVRGSVPPAGVWIGLATADTAKADALRDLPSFRLQYTRPETPTPWREAVTHAAPGLDVAALPVLSAGTYDSGRYVF
jgi:hypothetical protein